MSCQRPADRLALRRVLRRAAGGLAVALVLFGVLAGRCAWEAGQSLAAGQAALAAADSAGAVRHLGRALRWYVPGLAANRQAGALLATLAERAERAGRVGEALAAWRELRGGLLATRSLWQPQGGRLALADERIAHLMAGQGEIDGQGRPAPFAARELEHLSLLRQRPGPSPILSLLAVLAFCAWVGAAFLAIYWGLDETARPRWPRLGLCGGGGALAFFVWLLALWLA